MFSADFNITFPMSNQTKYQRFYSGHSSNFVTILYVFLLSDYEGFQQILLTVLCIVFNLLLNTILSNHNVAFESTDYKNLPWVF